jgi:hypothetical protein
MIVRRLLVASVMLAPLLLAPAHGWPATDPTTGLIVADGWQWVRAHCGGCHSYRLVTSQRGDATYWRNVIAWMQRTQNLWPIPAQQEPALIAYLARHYDEAEWGRRPGLAESLQPPPVAEKAPD